MSDLLGMIGGTLTTMAFVPQVWRVWKTRSTTDISLGMYAIFTTGVAFWLAYGVLLDAWPVIIANAITLALAATVLTLKLRYG